MALLLAGCERPATRTNWSPIDQALTEETATSLPEALPELTVSPEPAVTTIQAIGALDVDSLPDALPHSKKGYDLYSWQTGANWNFSLITGTDRTKAFDEIIAPGNSISADGFVKISVSSIEDLKKVLKLLPAGETILWGGMDLGPLAPEGTVILSFPPQSMIDELTTYCTGLQLTLTSLKTP